MSHQPMEGALPARRVRARVGLRAAALATAVAAGAAAAEPPEVTVSHGLTLVGELGYPPDFSHRPYADPGAPKGGEVRLHAIGSFDSFNPYIARGNPAGLGLVVETLMTAPNDEISAEYGLIARSVEVAADLSFVVYNLRPEARFHDGAPVTAEDVVFSFEALRRDGAPFYRYYYRNITRAEALGPHRVKFHFTGPPNRELPQITGQLPVLPGHYWEGRAFGRTTLDPPLGSGPYRIERFEAGRYIVFERVRDYWGADLPINRGLYNFDRVRIDYYRDQTVALEAFKAREYDYRSESSSKDWATGYRTPALSAGQMRRDEIPHARPTGMQAFAFNLRRAKFSDRRVRRAIAHAFDFEWSNRNLFYGQYRRSKSYFSNSELAARALPDAAETALLASYRGRVPEEVFTRVYEPPDGDGPGGLRANLRAAARLLRRAGWSVEDGRLVEDRTGAPFEIEFLLVNPAFERVVAPFLRNLRRLGIQGRIRVVDSSQYVNRLRAFDFDMIVASWGQSESPGNEQRDFWSSDAAGREGSRNLIGIRNPVVDELIETLVAAPDRRALVTAARALDRVLLWNHYVVPQWHITFDRIAYWDIFGRPAVMPGYGNDLFSWWIDPEKRRRLEGPGTAPGAAR